MDFVGGALAWLVGSAISSGLLYYFIRRHFDNRDAVAARAHAEELAKLNASLQNKQAVASGDSEVVREGWDALNKEWSSLRVGEIRGSKERYASIQATGARLRAQFGKDEAIFTKSDAAQKALLVANRKILDLEAKRFEQLLKDVASAESGPPAPVPEEDLQRRAAALMPAKRAFDAFEESAQPFIRGVTN